jgi:F-type H+-transporting ATPase subunit b
MNVQIGQVISQILAFLIMYWIMKRYAWKPILSVMENRRNRIQSEFELIDKQKKELADFEEESKRKIKEIEVETYEKLQSAIEKGKKVAAEIQRNAQDEAKQILKKARLDADQEVIRAKMQLRNELVSMTIAASEKILKSNLNEEKQRKLVLDFVNHIGV